MGVPLEFLRRGPAAEEDFVSSTGKKGMGFVPEKLEIGKGVLGVECAEAREPVDTEVAAPGFVGGGNGGN